MIMNVLIVSPSIEADDELLRFLDETNLTNQTAVLCKSISQSLCNIYNLGLEQNGISSERLCGKSLTLKIDFEIPSFEDFFDPGVDVMEV